MNNKSMQRNIDISRLDSEEVIKWCRDVFGDNDIMIPYSQRRWVTFYRRLEIRDYDDYVFAQLKWCGR